MTRRIGIIIGSLRRDAISKRIARALTGLWPQGCEPVVIPIDSLPLYSFDYDDPNMADVPVPDAYVEFRQAVRACDGIVFITPENNRTIPACLKNAIDVGSKPNSDVAWTSLPCTVISHSVGRIGGYSAHKNLLLALSYFDMPMLGQPEVFLSSSPSLFEGDEDAFVATTRDFLARRLEAFVGLVESRSPQR
ncbi:NAD(P)H-dependent oxidoreductase [Actinomyces sp. B33]|uniref:NADPH-dependent FMN reductase n=1 Tax=Actinomyces sp. B33 TaxID=2942131 RepID=UPI0023407710|nr:NADPH-dependent FMN reductase [Actinomyces sp. B33]MDC4233154.1 NAD(P)H-dependent oxidoreductase [Actinomyces sp. B33]